MKAVVEAVSSITDGSAEQDSTKYWEPAFVMIVEVAGVPAEEAAVVKAEVSAMSPMACVEPTPAVAAMTTTEEATPVAARVAPAVATTHVAPAVAAAVPVLRQRCRRPAQHTPCRH